MWCRCQSERRDDGNGETRASVARAGSTGEGLRRAVFRLSLTTRDSRGKLVRWPPDGASMHCSTGVEWAVESEGDWTNHGLQEIGDCSVSSSGPGSRQLFLEYRLATWRD